MADDANAILKGIAENIFSGKGNAGNAFSLDISKWAEQTKSDIALTVRKTAMDMFTRIVLRSPVDTGRFRANWYTSLGSPSDKKDWESEDKSGAVSISRINSTAQQYNLGDMIWMSNNLVYAWPLERGHSGQAPAGMVGITVQEFQSVFDRAAKSTKSFS